MPEKDSKPAVQPIPEDRSDVIPHLCIKGGAEAVDFYKAAFDAVEHSRMTAPDGRIIHAEISVGGCLIFLGDDFPEWLDGKESSPTGLGGTPISLHRYVLDCDAAVAQAEAAGAEVIMPVADMFWGDRYAKVRDPFGHEWSLATHVRDVSLEEMESTAAEMFSEQP